MSDTVTAFLSQNKVANKSEEVYVTDSFVSPVTGDPILWKIRPLEAAEEKMISDSCKVERKDRRTGTITILNDDSEYLARMCAQCVEYPDLGDRELQNSYGVKTKVALLREMLTAGELAKLGQKIIKLSDLDLEDEEKSDFEIEVEHAKNV